MEEKHKDDYIHTLLVGDIEVVVGLPKEKEDVGVIKELELTRQKANETKHFFSKIFKIVEEETDTILLEQNKVNSSVYSDAWEHTFKKVVEITDYFKKMIVNEKSFKILILKHGTNFNSWFSVFVKYYLREKIVAFFKSVATSLSESRETPITPKSLDEAAKSTYTLFENNYFDEFRDTLKEKWEMMYLKFGDDINKRTGPNFE